VAWSNLLGSFVQKWTWLEPNMTADPFQQQGSPFWPDTHISFDAFLCPYKSQATANHLVSLEKEPERPQTVHLAPHFPCESEGNHHASLSRYFQLLSPLPDTRHLINAEW
jgi:hypothetical protein